MNCRNCNEDVDRPCKTSDDCAGCYRMHDKPEALKMDHTTATMLELLAEQLSAATVTAGDIGIWTANRATLTHHQKDNIADMRSKMAAMRLYVQSLFPAKDAGDD